MIVNLPLIFKSPWLSSLIIIMALSSTYSLAAGAIAQTPFTTAFIASSSGLTSNSGQISASSRIYQTSFRTDRWSGDVVSYHIGSLGTLFGVPSEWEAQNLLQFRTAASRNIFTRNTSSNSLVEFKYSALASNQQSELRKQWPGTATVVENSFSISFAKAQIAHIRGASDSAFRDRSGLKLGDIVHSKALYVGIPSSPFYNLEAPGSYAAFRTNHIARIPTVYVGANDGMLHAFNAGGLQGKELFAYIPSMLIPKLNSLTRKVTALPPFEHYYFVDATPTSSDAFFSGAWHTVLVGGLGAGGKGIYALDITSAPSTSAPDLLWEFSEVNDADMGYSFSEPSIAKLKDGKWYAIFGNGYDSVNGKAVLYIVNIETGVHKKITFESASAINGLSTPTIIDTDGDLIADKVYAGDLLGKVWSYDLTSFSPSPANMSGGTILFTTETGQPITQKIVVKEHPLGRSAGYLLYFGTGQFFRTTDNSTVGQATQSVYGIWDCKNSACTSMTQPNLLEQKIVAETLFGGFTKLRVTSDHDITWLPSSIQLGSSGWESNIVHKGWHIDLTPPPYANNHGERLDSKVTLSGQSLIFSTLLPYNGSSEGGWLMSLDSATGGRSKKSSFDINGDGQFTAADFANWTDGGTPTSSVSSGVKSNLGIPSTPLILGQGGGRGATSFNDNSYASPTEIGIGGGADKGVRKGWLQVE